ncbi:MAG: hypothetical protein GY862_32465 [Gammaproteobacteria bacterium]|nr:hypothetical protein [Gammaproteobacteria bacterium]
MMNFVPLAGVNLYRVIYNELPDLVSWSLDQDPREDQRDTQVHRFVPDSEVDANIQIHGFSDQVDADMFVRGLEASDSDSRLGWI